MCSKHVCRDRNGNVVDYMYVSLGICMCESTHLENIQFSNEISFCQTLQFLCFVHFSHTHTSIQFAYSLFTRFLQPFAYIHMCCISILNARCQSWLVVANLSSAISVLWPFLAPTPLSLHNWHSQRATLYAPHASP